VTRLEVRRVIAADAATVWRLLTIAEEMNRWSRLLGGFPASVQVHVTHPRDRATVPERLAGVQGGGMREVADDFARRWLEAWNAHDLERILSLYEPDFELSSPVLAHWIPESKGRLRGREAARKYWSAAFAPGVNLRFEHIATLVGIGSFVIHYRGLRGRLCAEYFELSHAGRVQRSSAHEAEQTAP
jgi:hypothetical protein